MKFFKFKLRGLSLSIFTASICAIWLGGCASRLYIEPTQGERAKVRFATDTTGISILRSYDDSTCNTNEQEWMRLRKGTLIASKPKRLGIPLWEHHDNAAQEVYVNADMPLTLMFVSSTESSAYKNGSIVTTTSSCGVPFTYKFEKNSDYEVAFAMQGVSCNVTISEIVSRAQGPVRTQVKAFTNQISPEQAPCLDQFKKKRLY